MNYDKLKEASEIKLPVAAQKTTIYTPQLPNYTWVATTNSEVVGGGEHCERDEARAKLIALALNHHDELVVALQKLRDVVNYGIGMDEAFDQADELLHKIREDESR